MKFQQNHLNGLAAMRQEQDVMMSNTQQQVCPTYDKSKFRNQARLDYNEGRLQKIRNQQHSQWHYTDNNSQLPTNNQQRNKGSGNYNQNRISTSYAIIMNINRNQIIIKLRIILIQQLHSHIHFFKTQHHL
jgi:hypothetical protein